MCQGFPGALAVNNLPVMQETWVPSLGWEGLLEKGMQPTPVFLPGKSHGQRSLVGYSPWGHKESGTSAHICMHGCPKHNISKSLKLIREKGTIIHTLEGLHEI